MGPEEIQVGG